MKDANIVFLGTTVYLARPWCSVTTGGGENRQICNTPISFEGFNLITDVKSDASWTHKCTPSSNTDGLRSGVSQPRKRSSMLLPPTASPLVAPHNPHCSHTNLPSPPSCFQTLILRKPPPGEALPGLPSAG